MKYYCKWIDTRLPQHKRESRMFTFDFKDIPMKYRTNNKTTEVWIRGILSTKYNIPERNIYFREWGSLK